jgi:hypothetical protein
MASAANDREKALDAALAQIERQFGKGSIMRLGEEGRIPMDVIPTGSIALDIALGIGGLPRGRRSTARSPPERRRWPCMPSPTSRRPGDWRPSSTLSTRSIPTTPRGWASTSTASMSRSRTPVSRRWRSPTRWCDRERSTSS